MAWDSEELLNLAVNILLITEACGTLLSIVKLPQTTFSTFKAIIKSNCGHVNKECLPNQKDEFWTIGFECG